jgi:hypothetical protein
MKIMVTTQTSAIAQVSYARSATGLMISRLLQQEARADINHISVEPTLSTSP